MRFILICSIVVLLFSSCGNVNRRQETKNPEIMKQWETIKATDINDNPVTLFGSGMALAVGNKEKMNAMAIGWGGLGTLWKRDNPVVTVYIREDRYTRELLDTNAYFTLTAFPEKYQNAVNYFGTHSGRIEDKMKGSGLTVRFTDLGNPIFDEGRLILECRKIYAAPFSSTGFGNEPKGNVPKDKTRERFIIYIGEIVNVWEKK